MENRERLAMEANRRYVQDGLNRRRQESQLNAFEDAMIRRCNEKHDEACLQERAAAAVNNDRELSKSRIAQRAEEREKTEQTRKDVSLACLIFFAFAVVMLQLATWTLLPTWAALLCVALGVPFLVSFIRDPRGFPKD